MSAVRTSLRSALTAGLLGGALLAVPAQANAAGEARDHCVSNLSTGETACFGTFRDAVAHGTNGQVTDAPLSAHGAAADRALTARLTGPQTSATGQAAAYVLSIEFQLSNYDHDGNSHAFTGPRPCLEDGKRDYLINDIRDYDPWWNDRISSFRGYNTCDVNHYEHQVKNGGLTTGPKGAMATMGAMDNKTTGLTFG